MERMWSLDLAPKVEAAVYLAGAVVLAGSAYYTWRSGDVVPLVVLGTLLGLIIIFNDEQMSADTESAPERTVPETETVNDEHTDVGGVQSSSDQKP